MIDKIRFSKKNLSTVEIEKIIKISRLQSYDTNGLKHYNNQKTKNFNGGLYIKIGTDKALIIEGSLHKYNSFLKSKKLNNFDSFTMQEAKETLLKVIQNTGFSPDNVTVNFYEIGLNLIIDIDAIELLKNLYSIGDFDKEKIFYNDPKHKNQSQKITEHHKDFRVVFKAYDKIHEMTDRKKKPLIEANIIRIETIHKRVEKTLLINFFTDANLQRLQKDFFNNWDKLNFLLEIIAPPRTNKNKIEFAKILYKKSQIEVLTQIYNEYKNNTLSIKSYYNLKRFIENWHIEKNNFKPTKSIICTKWENVYIIEKQKYNEKIHI